MESISGLVPTTHLPTHPLGFLGGWAVQKTQKNPLLSKNHHFFKGKFKIILGYPIFL
jgi:hypothetical protein